MDTQEIDSLLNNLPHFRGVFPSDRIPKTGLKKYPQAIIINLDPHYLPGSHWIASIIFKRGKNKMLQFFDSYGMKPPLNQVPKDWIVKHNPYRFQRPNSKVCGQYCIYFVRERLLGQSFNYILKKLKKKKNPDNFVKKYVVNLKKNHKSFKYVLPLLFCQNCKPAPGQKKCVCKKKILWNLNRWG